jgi:biopolymer transport protein ExbD
VPEDPTVHYVSQRKKRGKGGKNMQPPLTPMIDVTFQLLIYFILTTTFRVAEGQIPGNLPTSQGPQQEVPVEIEPATVRLIPRGPHLNGIEFALDNAEPTSEPGELRAKLASRLAQMPDPAEAELRIVSRTTVAWQHVVEAYNQAVAAGWKSIGIRAPN